MRENRKMRTPVVRIPSGGKKGPLRRIRRGVTYANIYAWRNAFGTSRKSQMEMKKDLVGEYTGSHAPTVKGVTHLVRNRTRIYESEKGHLSYVITEQVTDQKRSLIRRETYVGLVTEGAPSREAGVFRLHLSPLDKPYKEGNGLSCDFIFSEDFNSYFLVFNWTEGSEKFRLRLKKTSENGSGRRRRQS
jgi:hypothetical protein